MAGGGVRSEPAGAAGRRWRGWRCRLHLASGTGCARECARGVRAVEFRHRRLENRADARGRSGGKAVTIRFLQPAGLSSDLFARWPQNCILSDRSGRPEIWVANNDGSGASQLTSIGVSTLDAPAWSPDSGAIAFAATVNGQAQVFSIRASGGEARQISSGTGSYLALGWSQDGRWILAGSQATGLLKIPTGWGQTRSCRSERPAHSCKCAILSISRGIHILLRAVTNRLAFGRSQRSYSRRCPSPPIQTRCRKVQSKCCPRSFILPTTG